jgi:hypothetical protein
MLRIPSFPRFWLARSPISFAAVAAAMCLLAACSTAPEYKYVTKISGGQRIEFPITGGGPAPAKQDGIAVASAQFLGPPRGGVTFIGFVIKNESGQELKKVFVEDVSDEAPVKILEDASPKMVNGVWRGISEPIRSAAPPFEWLAYLDASNRVYRFTVTLADGKTIALNQLSIFPAWMKEGMRLGFKAAEDKKEEEKKEGKPQS